MPFSGTVISKPKDGMSWPVIVAALLLSCFILFGLGVRKWCQYQKEMWVQYGDMQEQLLFSAENIHSTL